MTNMIARITRDLKVTYHANVRDANKKGNDAWLADSAEALSLRTDLSTIDMAKMFSAISGKEVKRFADRATAVKRLWALLDETGKTFLASQPIEAPVIEPKGEVKPKKEPKPKKEKGESKRKSNMEAKLFPADSDKNPYRANTQSHKTFEMILKHPGKTFREYAKLGARLNTIRAAIRDQHLRCE